MPLSPRFEQALTLAARLHRNQLRKGSGVPYVSHLLAVASLVLEHGGNEDEAIAALLHDAIEDQGGEAARQQIQRQFGDRVSHIVEGCTDADTTPKRPWEQRKQNYVERLRTASASVRLVSAADKLHNARSMLRDYRRQGEALWRQFKGGREGTLWYYRSVVTVLREAGTTPLVEELDEVVSELEQAVEAPQEQP